MANFQVRPQTLRDTATKITNIDRNFNNIMDEAVRDMQNLRNEWESEAAGNFIRKATQARETIQSYSAVIKSYADFLRKAADGYEESDRKLNNLTQNLFS